MSLSNIAPSTNVVLEAGPGATVSMGALSLGNNVHNLTVQGIHLNGGVSDTGNASNLVFAYNTISGTQGASLGFYFYAGSSGQQTNIQMLYNQMDHLSPSDLSPGGAGQCLEVDGGSGLEHSFTFSHNICGPGLANHYTQLGGIDGLTEDDNEFLGPASPAAIANQEHNNVLHIFGTSDNIDFSGNSMQDTDSRGQTVLIESGHFDNVRVNSNLDVEDPACLTNSQCYSYAFWIEPAQGMSFSNNTVIGSYWGVLLGDYESGDYSVGSNWAITHNILVQTKDNPDLSFENCPGTCGVDYNVTSDSSAKQPGSGHYVINWTPRWADTSSYAPLGLPFAAGHTAP